MTDGVRSRGGARRESNSRSRRLFLLAAGILLPLCCVACDEKTIVGPPQNCGHINAFGFELMDGDSVVVSGWNDAIEGVIEVPLGETREYKLRFLDFLHEEFEVADACSANNLTFQLGDRLIASVYRDHGVKWTFHVVGVEVGTTTVTLRAWHLDLLHATYKDIPINVVNR